MRGLPQLPREVSSDGREIWDWAAKLSDAVHRADRARNLRADIAGIQGRCGSCAKWMTKACHLERNVNGYSRGPSANDPKCGGFAMKAGSADLLEKWSAELVALATPLNDGEGLS